MKAKLKHHTLQNSRTLSCIKQTTRSRDYRAYGVRSIRKAIIAGTVTFCFLLASCCCAGAWLNDRYYRKTTAAALVFGDDADSRTFIAGMDALAYGRGGGGEGGGATGDGDDVRVTYENRAQLVDDFNSESDFNTESETDLDNR